MKKVLFWVMCHDNGIVRIFPIKQMEVNQIPPFTFSQRRSAAAQIRKCLPSCRIAFICDENADPEDAKKVKELNKEGGIDTFFYSSVTGEYLVDMLDTL